MFKELDGLVKEQRIKVEKSELEIMKEQGELYYFDIGKEQFTCCLDFDYKNRWLWYSTENNYHDLFDIDLDRGFKTPEACEKYIRQRVKRTCKDLLK